MCAILVSHQSYRTIYNSEVHISIICHGANEFLCQGVKVSDVLAFDCKCLWRCQGVWVCAWRVYERVNVTMKGSPYDAEAMH